MTEQRTQLCPDCGREVDCNPSFPRWCPACDWNLDPLPARPRRGARRVAEKAADRLARRLYEQIRARPPRGRGGYLSRLLTWSLACYVHLLTAAMAVGAVLLIVPGLGLAAPVRVLGAVLLGGPALYVQPFRRRERQPYAAIGRADAPALFALVDEVARDIGGPAVDSIVVTAEFNASYFKLSTRRPAIAIGLTLWSILEPQEWVALLGHELGHRVNGDLRRTAFVGRAIASVRRWRLLLEPGYRPARQRMAGGFGTGPVILAELLLPLVLIPLALLVETFGNGMQLLVYRQGQRSEYYADDLSAATAGTAAAVSLLNKMLIGDSCEQVMLHARRHRPDTNVWQAVREFAESVPEMEWQRRSRLAARSMQRVDISHPPTQLRARMLRDRPAREPSIVLDSARAEAIETEVARLGFGPQYVRDRRR